MKRCAVQCDLGLTPSKTFKLIQNIYCTLKILLKDI